MQNPDTAHPPAGPAPAFGGRIIVPGLATGHVVFHWILQSFVVELPGNPAGIPTQHRGRRRNPFRPRFGCRVGRASRRGGGRHSPAVLGTASGLVLRRLRPGLPGVGRLAGLSAVADRHGGGGDLPFHLAPARLGIPFPPFPGTSRDCAGRPRRRRQCGRRGRPGRHRCAAGLSTLARCSAYTPSSPFSWPRAPSGLSATSGQGREAPSVELSERVEATGLLPRTPVLGPGRRSRFPGLGWPWSRWSPYCPFTSTTTSI